MKVRINKDVCIGCGYCQSVEPKVFKVADEAQAEVIAEVTEETYSNVQEAMANCPVSAIEEEF